MFGDWLGGATFTVAILMQVTLCSQGFMTSVIYGGLATKVFGTCKRKAPTPVYTALSPPTFPADTTSSQQLIKSFGRPASIFVSTFNMGEGKLSKTDLVRPCANEPTCRLIMFSV